MPQIRMLQDRLVFFNAHGLVKCQTRSTYDVAERPRGEDENLMTTCFQDAADSNERVYVAGRSHRRQDETHRNDTGCDFLIRA
jgi:hypothetical protein